MNNPGDKLTGTNRGNIGDTQWPEMRDWRNKGIVVAVQISDWKNPDHRDACRIICTLAFQIATWLPDYSKLLLTLPIMAEMDRENSAELFDELLTNPLKLSITGGDGRNELVDVLARYAEQLPDWIGLEHVF